ncbi:MAG TPA: DUF3999 family protein [Acidobacteriaceae bacterium]|nr:DUF3999 family protein [Acidobacteriaceae bacterium]
MRVHAAVVLLAIAAATPEARYFRYERPVNVQAPNGSGAAQACAVLDASVFPHAQDGLGDLRLYRGSAETPYVIRTAAPVQGSAQKIAVLNLGSRAGQTAFDAAMPEGQYSDLKLDVSGANFIATVNVTGSQTEGAARGTKLGSYTIFDLTDQKLGRSTILHLPRSDFRYLHFAIDGPVKPAQIGGLSIDRLPQSEPRYTVIAETTQITQKGHDTIIQFSVPANVPVDRIMFVPGAKPANFSRDVTVTVRPLPARNSSEEEMPRSTSGYGNLLRVHGVHDGRRIDEEHLSVDMPGFSSGEAGSDWAITIENGDDPPLELKSVRLEMIQRKLCFDAVAGASYTLYYGDPALAAPRYDYARLFVAEKSPLEATLGPEQANPDYQRRPDTRPFTERHPWLLWVALAVVVLVLGAVALRTAKQTMPWR